jgi:WhiB family redox-sensing transcriptional regulator
MTNYRRTGLNWQEYAACREEDPELFFPTGNTGPAKKQIEEAKAICARCPAIGHCALYALERGENFGVWGGMSETERQEFSRRSVRRGTSYETYGQGLYEEFQQNHPLFFSDRGLSPLEPVITPMAEPEIPAVEQSNQNSRV